jgi:hypothetical protein
MRSRRKNFQSVQRTEHVPLVVREKLSTYAHALLDTHPCDDPRLLAMRKGADQIMVEGDKREGYNYAAAAKGAARHGLLLLKTKSGKHEKD